MLDFIINTFLKKWLTKYIRLWKMKKLLKNGSWGGAYLEAAE